MELYQKTMPKAFRNHDALEFVFRQLYLYCKYINKNAKNEKLDLKKLEHILKIRTFNENIIDSQNNNKDGGNDDNIEQSEINEQQRSVKITRRQTNALVKL